MKFISKQRLKSTLQRLLRGEDATESDTVLAPPPRIAPLNIPAEKIENAAQAGAALWVQHPNVLDPWAREWGRTKPDEVLDCQRDLWTARSLGVETAEYLKWDEKFTDLAAQFFDNPENRSNIVVADFSIFGEKGLYYKDANDTYHRLPNALQDAFPDVFAPLLPTTSAPHSALGGAHVPA